ncbi:NAD(P)H-hydrate dehydratase [Nocardioides sp. T2.26MG-1]|uniref:NAD(P)H-hydrate dehydratase n=1 Tax=Nocardioides sp. T2.26MG-1 TaxID=3041166 RepID=UPI0024779E1F|nr:NAD(P)H-hydrate dehydratase [Nocardioides sp. T2.26MG-1]CAI9413505.1 Bifunctional NAD(P)H-hydrate repair enzyme Nnr [Nocardioides sp. T2.26MG-1]
MPALLRAWPLSEPGVGKDDRGDLLVLGGSASTPGAALLAGLAALRAGAGKLAVATVGSAATALAVAVPEAQVVGLLEDEEGRIDPRAAAEVVDRAEAADAVLAGPGLEDPDRADALLAAVLPRLGVPVVLDALGTAYLTKRPDGLRHLHGRAVVTANPTELAHLAGQGECGTRQERLEAAAGVARRSGVVVLVGAEDKLVLDPAGRSWVVEGGGPGLGVSGSGDVQAGIVAGLLARGAEPAQAAVWGAYLHARAGERLAGSIGHVGYLARELPPVIPTVLGELI